MKTHTLIVRLAGFYLFAKAAFVLTDYYQQIPAALVAAMGDVPENVNAVRALEWEFRLGVAVGRVRCFRLGGGGSMIREDPKRISCEMMRTGAGSPGNGLGQDAPATVWRNVPACW